MGKIEQTLKKIKDDIKPLLIEMYPDLSEAISFAHQDNFQEWFGMLFEMHKWNAKADLIDIKDLILSNKRTEEVLKELEGYIEMTDFGYISVVSMEDGYHLIDGYHRVLLIAKEQEMLQLKGIVWSKGPNLHPNCAKIKKLIINNL